MRRNPSVALSGMTMALVVRVGLAAFAGPVGSTPALRRVSSKCVANVDSTMKSMNTTHQVGTDQKLWKGLAVSAVSYMICMHTATHTRSRSSRYFVRQCQVKPIWQTISISSSLPLPSCRQVPQTPFNASLCPFRSIRCENHTNVTSLASSASDCNQYAESRCS